jgi:type IV pilus assembly protein PilY1
MNRKYILSRSLHTIAAAILVAASVNTNVHAAPLAISNAPLFLNGTVPPQNMLIMGRDHKLYY